MDVVTLALAKQYTDGQRLAYEGIEEVTLLPETAMTHEDDLEDGVNGCIFDTAQFEYNFSTDPYGTICVVYIDGVRYECPAFGDGTEFYIGNVDFVLFENGDNGIPFIIMGQSGELEDGTTVFVIGLMYISEIMSGVVVPPTRKVKIAYTTNVIHPIDPKYIPALDSLTLNGADGKQYKLAVDESGALAATAIE